MLTTYIQASILIQTCFQQLDSEALGKHSLPYSTHVELASAFASGSSTAITHAPDEVEDLGAGRLIASAISAVIVQTRFADLDQSQRFVHVIRDDLFRKA